MIINYRVLRSDKDKMDIIKVKHNDRQDAIDKLTDYFKDIHPDYQSDLPGLSLWSLYDNTPCGYYKEILEFESPKGFHVIVQAKRIKKGD